MVLPRAARRLAPPPTGASLGIPGLTPLVTANDRFYRVDTAIQLPQIDPTTWSLRVTGMVSHPYELSFARCWRSL